MYFSQLSSHLFLTDVLSKKQTLSVHSKLTASFFQQLQIEIIKLGVQTERDSLHLEKGDRNKIFPMLFIKIPATFDSPKKVPVMPNKQTSSYYSQRR